jgi:hypothetical protein
MKTEQQTRIELIDKLLLQAGWSVNDPSQVVEEFDILVGLPEGVEEPRTPYEGHQFSDYVLLGKDGRPIAVVEAKKQAVMPPLAGNRRGSIVFILRGSWELRFRSVFIPMVLRSFSGISTTIRPERLSVSPPVMTLSGSNIFAGAASLSPGS